MTTKLKICRASGLPVEVSDIDAFKADFGRLYDRASKLCKKDMLRLQKKLARIENILAVKYPTTTEVEQPASGADWSTLVDRYGNIMVSKHQETDELVLVILDRDSGL